MRLRHVEKGAIILTPFMLVAAASTTSVRDYKAATPSAATTPKIPNHSAADSDDDDMPDYLPWGKYQHIDGVVKPQSKVQSLQKEMQNLGSKMEQTVKEFAAYRNMTCMGDPCQIQAFPIVYTSRDDNAFFGGVRAKVTNISRRNPYTYSAEGYIIRSDNKQWLSFLSLDFPQVDALPLDPRIKLRLSYSRSTETRYYGTGPSFIKKVPSIHDDDVRYSLKEHGFQTAVLIPLAKLGPQDIEFASSFSSFQHQPTSFRDPANSKLLQDDPVGTHGGIATTVGFGLFIDSRDREVLTLSGWALEAVYQFAGPPLGVFNFKRISVIDRRFATAGRFTFANRLTIDSVWGDVPFWELRSIGGIDPISDVSNSVILRGFPNGRFHEKVKIINSAELRYQLNTRKIFGLTTDIVLMPIGVDAGHLGQQNALGFSSGAKFLFNNNLLVQTYLSASRDQKSVNIDFGQAF